MIRRLVSMGRRHDRGTEIEIPFQDIYLGGELNVPANASGVVLFAHGGGSSRHSKDNKVVSRVLREHRLGTLLFDLLTPDEEQGDRFTRHLRFDIHLLAERLLWATRWFHENHPETHLGYFGSGTGGGAALAAEVRSDIPIHAIVTRGGRPDLAGAALPKVKSPTLLIVGGNDPVVIEVNKEAMDRMTAPREMRIVPAPGRESDGPKALGEIAQMAAAWFELHFRAV
jgi:putative phosphoribosyl transferase